VPKKQNNRFVELAMPHLDAVYRAAVALCGANAQAEDLAQTAMLRALEMMASFKDGTNCKAWLFQILRNAWIDQLRRRKLAGPAVPLDEALLPAAEPVEQTSWTDAHDLLENFADAQVIEALAGLPDDQRLTLYLVDVEGLDHSEVAAILAVPVGTVKSRVSRARSALKGELEKKALDLGFIGRVRCDSSK
jgi:RNA polymerase sigma-70 factor, ECF subfamily